MNIVNFYRLRTDGSVELAKVQICQPSLDTLSGVAKYGRKTRLTKRRTPTIREAEDMMLRAGWTRNRLKPTKRLSITQAVGRALRSLAA